MESMLDLWNVGGIYGKELVFTKIMVQTFLNTNIKILFDF